VKVGDLNAVVYASEDGYSQGKLLRQDMIVGRRDCSLQSSLTMIFSECDDCPRASSQSRVPWIDVCRGVVHAFLTLQGMVWRYLVALRLSRWCRLGLYTRLSACRILHTTRTPEPSKHLK
jgi:hypothetical protein